VELVLETCSITCLRSNAKRKGIETEKNPTGLHEMGWHFHANPKPLLKLNAIS